MHTPSEIKLRTRSRVLEVAFDAAQLSNRHKSGVALRFPRIARIRTDKPAAEADRLESLMALVEDRPGRDGSLGKQQEGVHTEKG